MRRSALNRGARGPYAAAARGLERGATDCAFGGRRWFDPEDAREPNLGGITEEDLVNLDPAKIDAELQLMAEVMAPVSGPFDNNAHDPAEEMRQAFENAGPKDLAPVQEALDRRWLETTTRFARWCARFLRATV